MSKILKIGDAKVLKKVGISRRGVLQRVNRRLSERNEGLRTWRTSGVRYNAGDLYRLDFYQNTILDVNVELESFAREVGALQPWEEIVE